MNPYKTRFFKHYKNKPYKFIGLVRHSETLEEMALYESLYENKLGRLWVRPKEMFFENVIINGKEQARFAPIQFNFVSKTEINSESIEQIKEIYLSAFGADLEVEHFNKKLKQHPQYLLQLVFEENRVVAFKIGYELTTEKFYSWLGAVHPDYQELGIATELMRQQHDWCKAQNYQSIETKTRQQFKKMTCLNLASSFEIVGTENHAKGLKILFEKKLS